MRSTALTKRVCELVFAALLVCLGASSVLAEEVDVTVDAKTQVTSEEIQKTVTNAMQRETGWYPKLRIGGSAALNYNDGVADVTDGTAFTVGALLKAGIDGVYKNLEWQNTLDIEEQFSKTPTLDSFIKSADKLDFNTMLLFRIPKVEWLGPFIRFHLQSPIFWTDYVSDKDLTIRYYQNDTKIDGKSDDKLVQQDFEPDVAAANKLGPGKKALKAQESTRMASAFEPLTLTESAGLFMNPYTTTPLTFTFKVGVAGQHLVTQGGYVPFDDNADDAFYDVKLLENQNSVGIEGEADLHGVITEIVNWSLKAYLYYPFVMSADTELTGIDLIHTDLQAKISVKISSWASIDYSLTAKIQPFVKEGWQINNTLLFTVGYDIFK